jgi:hypothetical protein
MVLCSLVTLESFGTAHARQTALDAVQCAEAKAHASITRSTSAPRNHDGKRLNQLYYNMMIRW